MFKSSPEVPPPPAYQFFGTPAASMDSNFQSEFGKANTRAGSKGEQILFRRLRDRNGWLPADVSLFCSMGVPGKRADIDFAICKGNRILLIDAKMYRQDGGIYWNSGDRINRNLGAYKTSQGKTVTMTRSMQMAKDILSREMPNHLVEGIVVFTNDPNNRKAKVPNTRFLRFPGKIRVYNDRTAQRYIASFLGGQKRTAATVQAERFLQRLTR